jgi:hypothetical protein
MPLLSIDPDDITNRLCELASAELCQHCELPVIRAITDIAWLLIQVNRLHVILAKERLRSANLEASIRAALGACDEGKSDPLAYRKYLEVL